MLRRRRVRWPTFPSRVPGYHFPTCSVVVLEQLVSTGTGDVHLVHAPLGQEINRPRTCHFLLQVGARTILRPFSRCCNFVAWLEHDSRASCFARVKSWFFVPLPAYPTRHLPIASPQRIRGPALTCYWFVLFKTTCKLLSCARSCLTQHMLPGCRTSADQLSAKKLSQQVTLREQTNMIFHAASLKSRRNHRKRSMSLHPRACMGQHEGILSPPSPTLHLKSC